MKLVGEALCFDRLGSGDVSVAGLIRTDLRIGSKKSIRDTDPVHASFYEKLEKWLEDGADEEVLPLSVEEIEICMGIMKSKIEISSETDETWTPNNVRLATGLLPEMQEFVAGQVQDSSPE